MKALTLTLLAALMATTAHAADYQLSWMKAGLQPASAPPGETPPGETPPGETPPGEPLTITLNSVFLPEATASQAYTFDFYPLASITGGGAPTSPSYTWGTVDPLPAGLSLSASGELSGAPIEAGSTDFEVVASYEDAEGRQIYTIIVNGVEFRATKISAGGSHTCAITPSGGVKCWGANWGGQLGDSSTTQRSTPNSVMNLSGVVSVSAGQDHTCAITSTGALKCWGANWGGALGDGTQTNKSLPVTVFSSGIANVSAGNGYTCAVTTAGAAKCWGWNDEGQVGDGSRTFRLTPTDVYSSGANVASIHTGYNHTCAITTGGAIKCWGFNGYGKLGDGTMVSKTYPVFISTQIYGVADVSLGGDHTCALTLEGGVKCWGSGDYGQIGWGMAMGSTTPVDVVGLTSGVAMVSTKSNHTCAVTTGGAVKCWGNNVLGQLGDSTRKRRVSPVDVVDLSSGVVEVVAGNDHSCARTSTGVIKCWGNNGSGELGDGLGFTRETPGNVAP